MKNTLLSILSLVTASSLMAAQRPNIVLIYADDLGYGDLSCYGATKLSTPNIDQLAKEGRMFTDAHSASAACTPSRYALLTGEYPHRKGYLNPVFLDHKLIIDTQKETIASLLKKSGYRTACVGKWHLGFSLKKADFNSDLKPGPLELGFDYFYGLPVVNSHPPFVYVENHRVVGLDPTDPFVMGKRAKTKEMPEKMRLDQIGGADAAHELYQDEHIGTKLTEKAVSWIKEQTGPADAEKAKAPFFLYFPTTNIHHPFTPHPRFVGTSQCGAYGDFVHELDWIVGELMKTLKEQGVADNTLVIVTSDNGGMFNETGQKAWKMGHELNGELLGFKFGAWEGGHRVPFIAHWPGKIPAGSTSSQLISSIDMLATFAKLTGQTVSSEQQADSVNILDALTGEPTESVRDHLVIAPQKRTHLSIRKGKWMYIGAPGEGGFTGKKPGQHSFAGAAAATFTGRKNSDIEDGKLIANAVAGQLYDLDADLAQTTNLYAKYPEIVKEMKVLLNSYKRIGNLPLKRKTK